MQYTKIATLFCVCTFADTAGKKMLTVTNVYNECDLWINLLIVMKILKQITCAHAKYEFSMNFTNICITSSLYTACTLHNFL